MNESNVFKKFGLFSAKTPCFSMVFTKTELFNSPAMFWCAVTFICIPGIYRELMMQLFHKIIPVCFCKNTGSCYTCIDAISFNNAMMWGSFIFNKAVTVNKKQPGFFL